MNKILLAGCIAFGVGALLSKKPDSKIDENNLTDGEEKDKKNSHAETMPKDGNEND